MTTTLFVQIRCKPGTAYNVADEIGLREIHSELYSISGDFDLLLKLHVPSEEDIGRYINDNLLNIEVSSAQILFRLTKYLLANP